MLRAAVTVLVDTYNHERFIEQALVSVLGQDFPAEDMEILVVDDGSTDRTPEIVRRFEPRVRLIRKSNGGQASAFNVGIPEAQGDIVAFLDGDDWWAPHKLKEVVDAFQKNPGIGVVGHGYYAIDHARADTGLNTPRTTCHFTLNDATEARRLNAACDLFGTSKLAVRREVLNRIGPIPEQLIFMADAFIFYYAIAAAGAVALATPLCYYRVHTQNLYETKDLERSRRRLEMQKRLVDTLVAGSSPVNVPSDVRAALAEPWQLNTESSLLSQEGGNPWRTFQVEWATYRVSRAGTSFGYRVFKTLVLLSTLVMPPRWFYRLKQWYWKMGLRRYRQKLGRMIPVEPVQMRRERVPTESQASSEVLR